MFSLWDLVDETMSAFRPRSTNLGGLLNLLYILRKSEPLGIEFKDTGCREIWCAKYLELQMGKLATKYTRARVLQQNRGICACSVRMALAGNQDWEPGIKSGFKGDSWFGSVTCADELESRN